MDAENIFDPAYSIEENIQHIEVKIADFERVIKEVQEDIDNVKHNSSKNLLLFHIKVCDLSISRLLNVLTQLNEDLDVEGDFND